MNFERPHFTQGCGYPPLVFYAVFGANADTVTISRTCHQVEELPEGLELTGLSREVSSQFDYLEGFTNGTLGEFLREKDPTLFDHVVKTPTCVLLSGQPAYAGTLSYLKNTIGIVQALLESGGFAVLDLQATCWYTAQEWKNIFFGQEFQLFKHVAFLATELSDGLWLHTRGMRLFGRPDLSLGNIPVEQLDTAKQLLEQMTFYLAQGAWIAKPTLFHLPEGVCQVSPTLNEDFEDPDFNNASLRMTWDQLAWRAD